MRTPWLVAGVAVLAVAWGVLPWTPLPPFSSHMLSHVGVVAVAAPLLAVGVAGTALDPVGRVPLGAIAASMVELVGVWAWHWPALHHHARHTATGFVLEQATFLGTGLLLWVAALGGAREVRRSRALGGIGGLLFTSMHMTLLGALLALSDRAIYGHGTALDQQVGGAIMLLVGGSAYLIGGLALVGDLLDPS